MSKIRKAIILAAGLGSRLKPLTDEIPKCLTEVNGMPIIEQTLEILEKNGIQETVIAIGYLGDVVIDKVGCRYRNMKISYLWNEIYDETNSMYSLWLAKNYLEDGAILIEGDTFFEEGLISGALEKEEDKTFWVADRFRREYEGSMSTTDKNGRIIDIRIVREQLAQYKDNYYKSTGILKITSEYGRKFSQWLDDEVKKNNVNVYYDLVIAKHLRDYPIYVYDITGLKWAELDSLNDLKRLEEIFTFRKYVIVIIDGAADLPIPELDNKTPLEIANICNTDFFAKQGRTGLMRTMYPGLPVGSIVANMGILGYNPLRYYPNGRASFEALAQDIFMDEDDIAFRCNLVSLQNDTLVDFTANNINYSQAKSIITNLKIPDNTMDIYPGQGYRNVLICRRANVNADEILAKEPHMNIGKPIAELLLKAHTKQAKKIVETLNNVMLDSIKQIQVLNKKFKTAVDMIFIWSPSSEPRLPSFHRKYGIDGAVISGLDFMRGIAIAARMESKNIPGVTGDSDTNLKEKLRYAINNLRYNDLVYIHLNAPDEESHRKNLRGKIQIIEKIDKEFVGPLKQHLKKNYGDKYRIAILPDHYTLVKSGKHSDNLVPYLICGEGIKRDDVKNFNEKSVGEKSRVIIKNYEFMDFLLKEEL